MIPEVNLVHISDIVSGDTVIHEGDLKTVTQSVMSIDPFMGRALWGDSYHGGRQLVERVTFRVPLPNGGFRLA